MKQLIIKITFVFSSIMFGMLNVVSGQVYSDEACIYDLQKKGKPENRFFIISFQGETAFVGTGRGCCDGFYKSDIEKGFKQSNTFAENVSKNLKFTYNAELSTSARVVYSTYHSGETLYLAVSRDLSSIKYWYYAKDGRVIGAWFGAGYYDEPAIGVRMDTEVFKSVSNTSNYNFLDD